MLQFQMRDLAWLFVTLAVASGWWRSHQIARRATLEVELTRELNRRALVIGEPFQVFPPLRVNVSDTDRGQSILIEMGQ